MYYDIGENYLRDLEMKVDNGDTQARQELRALNSRLVKVSNTRLSALEKADYDYYAYDRATYYTSEKTGRNRFSSASVNKDASELVDNIREMRTFLNSKTSTIRGQKALEKERMDWVKEVGLDIPKRNQKAFLRFLGSESTQNLFQDTGASADVVAMIVESRKNKNGKKGLSFAEIGKKFDAYLSGNVLYDDLFNELGISMESIKPTVNTIKTIQRNRNA